LAQRPGNYAAIKYRRAGAKVESSQALACAPGPQGPIEGTAADVSLPTGMLIDKFRRHPPPIYLHNQKAADSAITVRPALSTQIGR
jgi:hypothetical protein